VNHASPFVVTVIPDRTYVRVQPAGEIDLATCRTLRAQLDELWGSGWTDVTVDLRHVSFMDSSGVHVLIEAEQRATERGRRFSIIDGDGPVSRLLKLTGAPRLLEYAPDDRAR
jgi:anti-anti-sigma factor